MKENLFFEWDGPFKFLNHFLLYFAINRNNENRLYKRHSDEKNGMYNWSSCIFFVHETDTNCAVFELYLNYKASYMNSFFFLRFVGTPET